MRRKGHLALVRNSCKMKMQPLVEVQLWENADCIMQIRSRPPILVRNRPPAGKTFSTARDVCYSVD